MLDILLDVLKDTWMMFVLLYITYCVIEFFERKETTDDSMFYKLQRFGPLFGALIGLIPQCGFSILGSMLFIQNNITLGTLIAIMISTSDEAIPILIANPKMFPTLIQLLLSKFLLGMIIGYIVDFLLYRNQKILHFEDMEEDEDFEEETTNSSCPCCYPEYPLYISALFRSIKIYCFLFITSLLISLGIHFIGEETLSKILLSNSVFQPVLAAIFGFIPNCAATVVLAQLYTSHTLQFGSLLSGLMTNAGLGLVCLIRYGAKKEDIIKTISILFISASLTGIIFYFI